MYCLRGPSLETSLLTKSFRVRRRSLTTTRTLRNGLPPNFPPVRFAPSVTQPTLRAGWKDQSRAVRWTTYLVTAASVFIGVDYFRNLRDVDLAFLELTGKEGITMPRKKCLKSSDPQATLSVTGTLPWPEESLVNLGFPDPMAYLRPPFTLRDDDEKVVRTQEIFDQLLKANKLTNIGLCIKVVDAPGTRGKYSMTDVPIWPNLVVLSGALGDISNSGWIAYVLSTKIAKVKLGDYDEALIRVKLHKMSYALAGVSVLLGLVTKGRWRLLGLIGLLPGITLQLSAPSLNQTRTKEVTLAALVLMSKAGFDPRDVKVRLEKRMKNVQSDLEKLGKVARTSGTAIERQLQSMRHEKEKKNLKMWLELQKKHLESVDDFIAKTPIIQHPEMQ